ncbi:MAG: DNA polymerase III subunit gamma/tau [Candidatus Saccharimonadales bacterium]
MSRALYRKYRSKSLGELIGQKHITDILSRAISSGRVSHAYLLTGPRGVGKTSVARILAYEINGIPYDETTINLDIIEIDAASNNGVEDVRDLREKVQIAPVAAKKKIYIIDEVHMLSKAAFNALLKTLEEPPEHVVFILATTNVEKLPATIISRAQRFNFRPISVNDAKLHLKNIAKKEGIKIDDEALELIADRSDGSFRDSISLLDQLSGLVDPKDTITVELIEDALGMAPTKIIDKLLEAVETKDIEMLVKTLDNTFNDGIDSVILVSQLTRRISDLVSEKPRLISLLDALIDVPKSPQPQLKLLAVLGGAINQKTPKKTIALSAPTREISASVKELEEQVTKPKPKTVKKTVAPKADPQDFDWQKLIDFTRKNYIALYSVLVKCNYELELSDLTIYTSNGFYKKKLDDSKYSALLSKCLQDIGVYGLDIHTIPTTPPLKDSQAAAIAAIMGGGEEVSLESAS